MGEFLKLFLFVIIFFSAKPTVEAQIASVAPEMIYKMTEQEPNPKGGMCAFYEYTQDNLQRPKEAVTKGVRGNVFVQFIVEKDGRITNVKVVKGIGSGCDEEVVKLLENSPRWSPGVQKGQKVRVEKTMSIQVR
jgi:protein TonB